MQEEMQNNVDIQNNEEALKRKVKAVVLASAIFFVFLITFIIVQSVQIAVINNDVKKIEKDNERMQQEIDKKQDVLDRLEELYPDIARDLGYEPND